MNLASLLRADRAIWLLAFVGAPSLAQVARISAVDSSACPNCTHRAEVNAVLGKGSTDTPLFSLFSRVSRDSRGRLVVGPVDNFANVAVFSPDGALIKMLGRAGEGPGEFRSVTQSGIMLGDSIWVLDTRLRRLSIFSPEFRFVRSVPFAQHKNIAFVSAGTIAGLGDIRSPDRIGRSLHLYESATGAFVRSIGPEKVVVPRMSAELPFMNVMSDARGQLWVTALNPLRFVLYEKSGAVAKELRAQLPWIPYPAVKPRTKPGRPATAELPAVAPMPLEPTPAVNAASISPTGEFWIIGAVPSVTWRSSANPFEPPPPERKAGATRRDPSQAIQRSNAWYDTMVEALAFDPTGKPSTVVRAKLNVGVTQLLGENFLAGMAADSDGLVSITVWKLRPK